MRSINANVLQEKKRVAQLLIDAAIRGVTRHQEGKLVGHHDNGRNAHWTGPIVVSIATGMS